MAYYQASPNPPVDPRVRVVQNKLNAIRRSCHGNWAELSEDGRYGQQTAQAVKAFQIYRGLTPASGMLGPTTMEAIDEIYAHRFDKPVQVVGNLADAFSKVLDPSLSWMKFAQMNFPEVYRRLKVYEKAPYFVFNKKDAYHRFGSIYKRLNGVELNTRIVDYLSTVAFACQWMAIVAEINDIRSKLRKGNMEGKDWAGFGKDLFLLLTGTADVVVKHIPRAAAYYSAAETGAAFTLRQVTLLSTAGQCIGAFLLGWEIGKFIREIPCGRGETVGDCIDTYIQEIWEHPYQMLWSSGAAGMSIALLLDAWKKAIEWNVNRMSNLKPLTAHEKWLLEQVRMRNREMYIQAAPPKCYIYASR